MVKLIVIVLIIVGGYAFWKNSYVPNNDFYEAPTNEQAVIINGVDYSDTANQARVNKPKGVIHLYATSWCGYCTKTRQLFRQKGVHYQEYDIEKDGAARMRYQKLGGRGVPLVEADGKVIKGYNEQQLMKLVTNDRYKL